MYVSFLFVVSYVHMYIRKISGQQKALKALKNSALDFLYITLLLWLCLLGSLLLASSFLLLLHFTHSYSNGLILGMAWEPRTLQGMPCYAIILTASSSSSFHHTAISSPIRHIFLVCMLFLKHTFSIGKQKSTLCLSAII